MDRENYLSPPADQAKPSLAPGQSIGNLLLLSRDGTDAHGNAMWLCRCLCCGKDKRIRVANIKAGRTKSCGCRQHATTLGRRNQMSTILAAPGVDTRFHVLGYFSPPVSMFAIPNGMKAGRRPHYHAYAVVFVMDTTRRDCSHGDMSKYYVTMPVQYMRQPGNQNQLLDTVLHKLHKLGWIAPRPVSGTVPVSAKRWAEIEGVTFRASKVSTRDDLFVQQEQMMRAAHIDYRGQVI